MLNLKICDMIALWYKFLVLRLFGDSTIEDMLTRLFELKSQVVLKLIMECEV